METALVKVPGKVRLAECARGSQQRCSATTQVPGEPEYCAAFEHTYIYDPATERRFGALQWHDTVPRMLNREHELRESLHPRYPPMLVRSKRSCLRQLYPPLTLLSHRSRLAPGQRSVASLTLARQSEQTLTHSAFRSRSTTKAGICCLTR